MDNLINRCQKEILELKQIVERLIKGLGVNPISSDLQQKFNNFNNQHNTYIKAINDNSSINEILKFSRAVGLQASVLGSAIIQDKLIDVSQHELAIQLRDSSNKFRDWVEAQFEFGSPYEETVNTEKLDEKQNRMLRNKKKIRLKRLLKIIIS